jgi:Na+/H+ antiporter NhaD/arsenite permease-like protein
VTFYFRAYSSDSEGHKICCLGPFLPETLQSIFRKLLVLLILLVIAGLLSDLSIGWTAAGGAVAAMALDATVIHKSPERILARVNWDLLIFFSGLFIYNAGFQATEIPAEAFDLIKDRLDISTVTGVL